MTRNEYILEKLNEPNSYLVGYVAFLDILGFKELCKTQSCEIIKALFDDILLLKADYINSFAKMLVPQKTIDEVRIKIISDSIVVTAPDDEYGISFLLWFCSSLQNKLLNCNVILRGGIDYGLYFSMENTVFGPALIGAYEIENSTAIYPRVVLSDNVFRQLDKIGLLKRRTVDDYLNDYLNNKDEYRHNYMSLFIKKDDDEKYFIHYFNTLENIALNKNLKRKKQIEKFILNNMKKNEKEENLFKKYNWLNNYYQKNVAEKWTNSILGV